MFYIICSLIYFHIKIFLRVKQKPQKPCQLSRLDNFVIDAIANLFVHERLSKHYAEQAPLKISIIS